MFRLQRFRLAVVLAWLLVAVSVPLATAEAQVGAGATVDVDVGDLERGPGRLVVEPVPGADKSAVEAAEASLAAATSARAAAGTVPAAPEAAPLPPTADVVYSTTFPAPSPVRTVVEQAVADWAAAIDVSGGPVEILVEWFPFGSDQVLGAASFTNSWMGGGLPAGQFTPGPLANVLLGIDVDPINPEIQMALNADLTNWFIGTTGTPAANEYDLYTVVLHELAHGFGFAGSAASAGGAPPVLRDPPLGYDTHVYHGTNRLLDAPDPNSLLTSDNLFFDVPDSPRQKLHAPTTWVEGDSYSHFDETTYPAGQPGALMTPDVALGEVDRVLGDPELGVMDRVGWTRRPPPRLTVLPTPCPLHDSTTGTGTFAGPIAAGATRTVQVTGALPAEQGVGTGTCVPNGATAVIVGLSALAPSGPGNFRLSAAGVVANGGVVNYVNNGLNNANTVTVPLSDAGQVDIFANASDSGVRLVALGYQSRAGTLRYRPLIPCAVADSRPGQGATGSFVGPFAPAVPDPYPDLDVVGSFPAGQGGGNTDCGVPSGADAVVVNLVAVRSTGGTGALSATTGGGDPSEPITPFADINLNNAATTVIPLSGETIAVDIELVSGSPTTHVRVVVLGYLDTTGADYFAVNPCAAFDTRPGQGASGSFLGRRVAGSDGVTTYRMTGTIPTEQGGGGGDCGVPRGARAVLVNLVGIQPLAVGNFRAYATGTTPTGGVLNWAPLTPPMNNSNAVVVPLNADGQLDLFTNAPANTGNRTVHARGVILGYYRGNQPPVLAPIGNQFGAVGTPFNIALSATDPDGDAMTFDVAPGLPFCLLGQDGAGNGTLNCNPSLTDGGQYQITVTVTDAGVPTRADRETFTLTIATPAPNP